MMHCKKIDNSHIHKLVVWVDSQSTILHSQMGWADCEFEFVIVLWLNEEVIRCLAGVAKPVAPVSEDD